MFIQALLSGLASLIFQPLEVLASLIFGPILSILFFPWPLFLLIAGASPSE